MAVPMSWTPLASYARHVDADLACQSLQSAGICARLMAWPTRRFGAHVRRALPRLFRLDVADAEVERARALLAADEEA